MKKWYQSKMLWFGLLTIVVGVATGFGFGDFQPDAETVVLIQAIITIVVGVGNIILRLITEKKITL